MYSKEYIQKNDGVNSVTNRFLRFYLLDKYGNGSDVFMICDTVDGFDWEKDWARLAEMPRQAEWEAFVAKAQGADPALPSNRKWQLMDKIFDMNEQ